MGKLDAVHIEDTSAARVNRRGKKRVAVRTALLLLIVLFGMMGGAAYYLRSIAKQNQISSMEMVGKVSWRVRLFALKARGGIPDLSWSELWWMAGGRRGFGLGSLFDGRGLNASVENPYTSDADHQAASSFFSTHCAVCHGKNGAGGEIGPPLDRLGLKHGDSDLSIYKTIRGGVPDTAMAPVPMSVTERWQLVGYIRQLQDERAGLAALDPSNGRPPVKVGYDQIVSAGSKTDEWLTYSGSLDGHHYTPLNQITTANVAHLRIRWVRQFDTPLAGSIEATPLVVNGTIFTTEPAADTFAVDALDAATGNVIWRYSRSISPAVKVCCGRVNRGVAILENHLYVASLDGYLICLDVNSGKLVWETHVVDGSHGYSMTGAPLIANRHVVVGIAGAEYAIRGFVAAYDADTGKQIWQFNTIPGPGEAGHETWNDDSWKTGGGSTWVTGSYDPSLDLIYWGVGNPAPAFSGDDRAGDDLFSNSVVALRASDGKLAWHFQFTPHDEHDWDSCQTPVLGNLSVKGKDRKVIAWANRNGFYYVLDRVTGEFLTGVPFVEENWAKGLDSAGRPIPTDANKVTVSGQLTRPSGIGGTIYQNPAFDQKRGLFFVPATEAASVFTKTPHAPAVLGQYSVGSAGSITASLVVPVVRALDAATGTKKWEYFSPTQEGVLFYGGLLATGGNLVFGTSNGYAFALDSMSGREAWRVSLGGATRAAPISFTLGGQQVVAVSAGRSLFLFGL